MTCKTKLVKCTKSAGYGYKNGPRQFCVIHKADDMINLKGYICAYKDDNIDCTTRASFGYDRGDTYKYCGIHKKPNMINIINKTCKKCNKQPCYNIRGKKGGIYCLTHKDDGMIDVTKKTCKDKKCDIIPTFGKLGGQKEYCSQHKRNGMISLNNDKCIHPKCGIHASFNHIGETTVIYCFTHKKDGMINVFLKNVLYVVNLLHTVMKMVR
jgi:hypothetical protein